MSFISEKIPSDKSVKDIIRIKGDGVIVQNYVVAGKQGDFWICFIPSLNISGYGKTPHESQEFLEIELKVFCEDIMGMPTKERKSYLLSLGFANEKFHAKNFSKTYVDSDGKLQNFEPGTLEHKVIKSAI